MEEKNQINSFSGCFVRVIWMALGNLFVALTAISIMQGGRENIFLKDAVFLSLVAVTVLARYLDVKYLHGQTAEGEPATMAHFKKYAAMIIPIYFVLLLIAHIVRPLLFKG
jgi:hypothetical protein